MRGLGGLEPAQANGPNLHLCYHEHTFGLEPMTNCRMWPMELKVIVKKGESGYYVARVPALKGCWSQGKTQEEAIANAKEAAALWLEVEQEKQSRQVRGKAQVFGVHI